ncbi:MAG TPA: hypothetical protein ENI38_03250 [Candidatus Acetothermia bacterium]|nr:hypothetical protein [Candidatus Acetothermia bacterium]
MKPFLLALIVVMLGSSLAAGMEVHGSFDISISLDPGTGTLQDLSGTCTLIGSWGFLRLGSTLDFEEIGLTWILGTLGFDAGVAGVTGDALFGAVNAAFLYGLLTGWMKLGGAEFYGYYVMADPDGDGVFEQGGLFRATASLPGGALFESLTMFGADMSGVSFAQPGVDKTYYFAVAPQTGSTGIIEFTGQKITFSNLGFGCAVLESETYFTKSGFEYQLFSITVHTATVLTLEVDILFTVQTKSVTITPILDLSYGCVYVYTELQVVDYFTITGLTIYGVRLEASFGNFKIVEIMSFDEVNYDLILDPYWEQFTVEVCQPACCGGYAIFRVDTYFEEGSLNIFDWGRTDFYLEIPVASFFTLWSGMGIDPSGLVEWEIGCSLNF